MQRQAFSIVAADGAPAQTLRHMAWRPVLSALCACLVGIGLARFAYTPLIPALIAGGWMAPDAAAYLGAANLAGYLIGALAARRLLALVPAVPLLRGAMLLVAASFLACAEPSSFAWFCLWRTLSGIAGGILMVLAAPLVLPLVPQAKRGLAGGMIFTGVGLGAVASGLLMPFLLRFGLTATWCGLGLLSLALALVAWAGWPSRPQRAVAVPVPHGTPHAPALRALYAAYALNAVGLVPHMVFLVDFVARGLGQGIAAGARYWVIFGIGALIGPTTLGWLADRIGFVWLLRLSYLVQGAAVALLAVAPDAVSLTVSSLVMGAFAPGISTLVLGRVRSLLPHDPQGQMAGWSIATIAFSIGQAAGGYGLSFVFGRSGGFAALFVLAALVLVAALATDLASALAAVRRRTRRGVSVP
jgi:predicted MFS family arabinose efflux permease